MQSANSEYGSPYLAACHFHFFLFFRSIIYLFDVRPPLSLDTKIKAICFTLTTETYLTIVVKATYSVKFEVVHSLEKATDTKYQGFFYFIYLLFCAPYVTQDTKSLRKVSYEYRKPTHEHLGIFL